MEPQFVKDIKGVGQKMTRNGHKMNYGYYSFRWISLYFDSLPSNTKRLLEIVYDFHSRKNFAWG